MVKIKHLQPEVSEASEVLHLKLWEGTAFDYSLNSNAGTATGTDIGYVNLGFELNGTDDHIVVGDDAVFTPILTPFSVLVWVNMDTAQDFNAISKGEAGVDLEWHFIIGNDSKGLVVLANAAQTGTIATQTDSTLTEFDNKWTLIGFTYDGSADNTGIKIYINGAAVAVTPGGGGVFDTISALGHDLWVGRLNAAGGFANGTVSGVRVYSSERTASQVKDFYEQTRWRYSA